MTLREVTPGSTVKVTKLTGEGPVKGVLWTWVLPKELIFL